MQLNSYTPQCTSLIRHALFLSLKYPKQLGYGDIVLKFNSRCCMQTKKNGERKLSILK